MASGYEAVALVKSGNRWRRIPKAMRATIEGSVERVRQIHLDIAKSAKVSTLPPVRIIDVCWTYGGSSGGCIHGRAAPIRVGTVWIFGVEIPAATAVFADDTALRGILLHEMSHCFNKARRVVAHLGAGGGGRLVETGPSGSFYESEEWDRKRLEPPELWFGDADVAVFVHQQEEVLTASTDRVARHWVAKGLPTETPRLDFSIPGVAIPQDVIDRIRQTQCDLG